MDDGAVRAGGGNGAETFRPVVFPLNTEIMQFLTTSSSVFPGQLPDSQCRKRTMATPSRKCAASIPLISTGFFRLWPSGRNLPADARQFCVRQTAGGKIRRRFRVKTDGFVFVRFQSPGKFGQRFDPEVCRFKVKVQVVAEQGNASFFVQQRVGTDQRRVGERVGTDV